MSLCLRAAEDWRTPHRGVEPDESIERGREPIRSIRFLISLGNLMKAMTIPLPYGDNFGHLNL